METRFLVQIQQGQAAAVAVREYLLRLAPELLVKATMVALVAPLLVAAVAVALEVRDLFPRDPAGPTAVAGLRRPFLELPSHMAAVVVVVASQPQVGLAEVVVVALVATEPWVVLVQPILEVAAVEPVAHRPHSTAALVVPASSSFDTRSKEGK